jgi:hypothetical protein
MQSNDVGGVSGATGYSFSRASAAYYTNSDGTLELFESGQLRMKRTADAGHNLLTYSQEFDNAAWGKARATVTANAATAPDGTSTADKLVEDATASNTHFIRQTPTLSNVNHAVSAFAKAGERSWLILSIQDGTNAARLAWFNLSDGTIGTVGTNLTAYIEALTNGWYRRRGDRGVLIEGARTNLLLRSQEFLGETQQHNHRKRCNRGRNDDSGAPN